MYCHSVCKRKRIICNALDIYVKGKLAKVNVMLYVDILVFTSLNVVQVAFF